MKPSPGDTVALSRQITRSYYAGDMKPYFDSLTPNSVWLGTGGRLLVGADAIRTRLAEVVRKEPVQIYQEDYYPFSITPRCQAVVGEVLVGRPGLERGEILATYTFLYRLADSEAKLALLHANYEFLTSFALNEDGPKLEMSSYQFVRDILLDIPPKKRLTIPCGGTSLFVQPDMIFYVQSKNRKAELFCVDKILHSDLSISEVNAMLPETFCPIHRCYTVNTRYVMSVQRCEVTLITGDTLPIPYHAYTQVKAELERRISG